MEKGTAGSFLIANTFWEINTFHRGMFSSVGLKQMLWIILRHVKNGPFLSHEPHCVCLPLWCKSSCSTLILSLGFMDGVYFSSQPSICKINLTGPDNDLSLTCWWFAFSTFFFCSSVIWSQTVWSIFKYYLNQLHHICMWNWGFEARSPAYWSEGQPSLEWGLILQINGTGY